MQALVPVAALLLSVAILLTGSGLQGILLPIRAGLDGFSAVEIGLVGSCYFAGFAAGCLGGPRLVRNVGHIRTFTAMTAIAAVIALAHSFLSVPWLWWGLRAGSGFCFAVLFMVIESWLNERSTRANRGFVLSAYMVINLTVLTLGQMLLPLQDPRGMELFAIVSMLVSLAAVPVALTRATAPEPIASSQIRLRRLYGTSPAAVVTCLAVGLANSAFWALGPLFAQSRGLGDTGIALFMSAAVLGGALGQWPLGRLSDRSDRRKVIVIAAALGAAAGVLLSMPWFESDLALMLTAALWGSAAFPLYSLAVAHANDHAAPGDFVEVAGGLLLVYAGGAVVGPLLASVVTLAFDVNVLYLYPAATHLGLIAFVVWRMFCKAAVPLDEHVEFLDSLQAAQTVSQVFDVPDRAASATPEKASPARD